MALGVGVDSERKIGRLLQIGMVLEEVVEARAYHHYHDLEPDDRDEVDDVIVELLEEAAAESAEHRERLEELIAELDAESIPFERVEELVREHWVGADGTDFDDILYDQLNGEETAYKFYDDLIAEIENTEATFDIDRDRLLRTLREIRDEEEAGVREVTEIMEARS